MGDYLIMKDQLKSNNKEDIDWDIVPLFPSLFIWWNTVGWEENKDELIKFVYDERRKDKKGVEVSNRGGWQSPATYHRNSILAEYVLNNLSKYLNENQIFIEGTKLDLNNLWININKKGNYNVTHMHPLCDLSGVMWLKTPDKCGNITFRDPTQFQEFILQKTISKKYKKQFHYFGDYDFYPKEGRLLLFPSHLAHLVQPNESRQDRISISFNIRIEPPEHCLDPKSK